MITKEKLPIGIDNFEKIISDGFYYVDKTDLIIKLLQNWGEVNLFTRPRCFGKSLNMSMLRHFFEIGCEKRLFQGLKIAEETALCEKYMGQFPVISITLKGITGQTYEAASSAMRNLIGKEALRFEFLLNSSKLSEHEKKMYEQLVKVGNDNHAIFSMSDSILSDSLQTLSMLLFKHYERKVIILIDEYDVPLKQAFQLGYYEDMTLLIQSMFGNALKSNKYLQFAVVMGCQSSSAERIFYRFTHTKIHAVTDIEFGEFFGFTDTDVRDLLARYHQACK